MRRRVWLVTAVAVAAAAGAAVATAPAWTSGARPEATTAARTHRAASGSRPFRPAPLIPALGSPAAQVVGGPLMASTGIVVDPSAGAGLPVPDVPASAWVIANADTGQVLAAKDP